MPRQAGSSAKKAAAKKKAAKKKPPTKKKVPAKKKVGKPRTRQKRQGVSWDLDGKSADQAPALEGDYLPCQAESQPDQGAPAPEVPPGGTPYEEANEGGRPRVFERDEVMNELMFEYATTDRGLRQIIDAERRAAAEEGRQPRYPCHQALYLWLKEEPGLLDTLSRARELKMVLMEGDLLDIADDGANDYMERERKDGSKYLAFDIENVKRSELRVRTRQWVMERVAGGIYGPNKARDPKAVGGKTGGAKRDSFKLVLTVEGNSDGEG